MPQSAAHTMIILPHERGATIEDLVTMLTIIQRLQHAYEQLPMAAVQKARAEEALAQVAMEQRRIAQRLDMEEQKHHAYEQAQQRLRSAYHAIAQNTGGISHDLVYPDLDASRIAFHLDDTAIDKRIAELEVLMTVHETKMREANALLASPLSVFQSLDIISAWKQIIRTSQDKIHRYRAELDKLAYTKQILPILLQRIEGDLEELNQLKQETDTALHDLYHPQQELEQIHQAAMRLTREAHAHDRVIESYRYHYPHLLPPLTEPHPVQWLWEKGISLRSDFLNHHRHHTNDDINRLMEA